MLRIWQSQLNENTVLTKSATEQSYTITHMQIRSCLSQDWCPRQARIMRVSDLAETLCQCSGFPISRQHFGMKNPDQAPLRAPTVANQALWIMQHKTVLDQQVESDASMAELWISARVRPRRLHN